MKSDLNLWTANHAELPGVLACGVRYPDNTVFSRSYRAELPSDAIDEVWRWVADASLVLQLNRLPTEVVSWVFDKAVIYCTRRKDATYLALLTVKDPAIVDPEEITRLLAEFRSAAQSPVPSDHEQPANAV